MLTFNSYMLIYDVYVYVYVCVCVFVCVWSYLVSSCPLLQVGTLGEFSQSLLTGTDMRAQLTVSNN